MKLTPVSCQNCGATIEIPDQARFVTCQFCRTQLSVQHTESTIFTELLGDLTQTTARMAENLEAIRIQNEIEKLDREWEATRAPFLSHDEKGNTREPASAAATVGCGSIFAVLGVAMIIGYLTLTANKHIPGVFTALIIFPIFFIVAGLHTAIAGPNRVAEYQRLRRAYEENRRALESQLRR